MTATMNGTPARGFDTLQSWLADVDPAKLAGVIPAESEHDDGGTNASEGARSSENDADVKKITNGNAVPGGTKNPSGKMDEPVPGSGLNQSTTGKNPEVERAIKTVKGEEEKMANANLDTPEGFKAAHDALLAASAQLPILLAHCGVTMPAEQPASKQASNTPIEPGDPAGDLGFTSKEAADAAAAAVIAGYTKMGADRAVLTARYLSGFYDAMAHIEKMANDGTLEAALAAQGGGEPGGAPPMDPAAGGAPPAAMAGAGGDPGAGGAPGGEPSMDEIIAALQELGITPEQLQEIISKAQGGVEAAPTAGPESPEAASPVEKAAALDALKEWSKLAAEMTPHMRSGKYQFKPAGDGTLERQRRQAAKGYIQELRKFAG